MIEGVRFAGIEAGIKPKGLDMGLVFFEEEMNALATYTSNKVKAAHILYDRKKDSNPVRALLANSGCANACTGKEGVKDLSLIAGKLSEHLEIPGDSILFASTGVIGRRLPVDSMLRSIPRAVKELKSSHPDAFAQAIMTTDTHPKMIKVEFQGKKKYSIMGFAKGSGMINPLFATMLAFVFTDYPVEPQKIKRPFVNAVRESFERITVDGDCSTNDTVMLFTKKGEDPKALPLFEEQLALVLKELSLMVVKDGEGATRVIHITVKGARKKEYAEKIARRIATSPLVKTAFFGCDPNWGRIIAAAGDAGVPLNQAKVMITLQGETLVRNGVEIPFHEESLKKLMNKKEVEVSVDLNDGKASYDIYTADLTYDYIKINASYRS